ncbi:MAG: protein adenylyltransferase SelO [Comamonas sp.]
MNPLDSTRPAPADGPVWGWQPGFAALGPAFFTALQPTPVPAPHWVAVSENAARTLGLPAGWLQGDEALQAFSGNQLLPGSQPMATVYSGHQFGVWAGQLGDGRAIVLGETAQNIEIQLKGAGRTPYSRGGDGRAVLRSSIREFLCSEAMHALGIPTTRALAITGSPLPVQRETRETAAVVTRFAPSFIRFGHFEHFAARDMLPELRALTDYVIDRYYPACRSAANPPAALLQAVSERTAELLSHWQAVGFCHGVMNTDNMSILGLTIDYGPFQFLDTFDPGHICNHSDAQGRYAFNRQPQVAYWNLFCLAQALMPLIEDQEAALAALETYKTVYAQAFLTRMRAKLGWVHRQDDAQHSDSDGALVEQLLGLLAADRVDYTVFWLRLTEAVESGDFTPVRDLFLDREGWDDWLRSYSARLVHTDGASAAAVMRRSNPRFVLRNHLGELAIRAASAGDFSVLQQLQQVLERPYDTHPDNAQWSGFAPEWASSIAISCSS